MSRHDGKRIESNLNRLQSPTESGNLYITRAGYYMRGKWNDGLL